MTDIRYETRYPVEWATCPNCGADDVYATHDGADEDMGTPSGLRVHCNGCGSIDARAGMGWKVVTVDD